MKTMCLTCLQFDEKCNCISDEELERRAKQSGYPCFGDAPDYVQDNLKEDKCACGCEWMHDDPDHAD